MIVILKIALRNLIRAKRRSFLLGTSLMLVAWLFFCLRTITSSVSENMIRSATTLSSGHVNLAGFFKFRKKSAAPLLAQREIYLNLAKELVPEAAFITDRHRGWGRVIGPSSSFNSGLSGILFDQEKEFFQNLKMAQEKEYIRHSQSDKIVGDFALLAKAHHCLLFASQAKKLGVKPGDTITITTEASGGATNSLSFYVAAVASDLGFMSNWNVYLPRQDLLTLYDLNDQSTGAILIYLKDPSQSLAVMERLKKALLERQEKVMDHDPVPFFMKFDKVAGEDWLGQKLDLTIWSDEISFILWITTALNLLSFFIVLILCLMITGGMMNALWISVRERTKEIGTMRAIGVGKKTVIALFVLENGLLGLFASLTGSCFAAVCLYIINHKEIPIESESLRMFLMAHKVYFPLNLGAFEETLLLFSFVGALAAFLPAMRAAKLSPSKALKGEQ